MTTKQRYRRLRAEVHTPTVDRDATWGTADHSYSFDRNQYLLSLQAIVGTRESLMDRDDFQGTWEAVAWNNPQINDGDRLVITLNGNQEKVLHVHKSMVTGRKTFLFLKEIGAIQDHT